MIKRDLTKIDLLLLENYGQLNTFSEGNLDEKEELIKQTQEPLLCELLLLFKPYQWEYLSISTDDSFYKNIYLFGGNLYRPDRLNKIFYQIRFFLNIGDSLFIQNSERSFVDVNPDDTVFYKFVSYKIPDSLLKMPSLRVDIENQIIIPED